MCAQSNVKEAAGPRAASGTNNGISTTSSQGPPPMPRSGTKRLSQFSNSVRDLCTMQPADSGGGGSQGHGSVAVHFSAGLHTLEVNPGHVSGSTANGGSSACDPRVKRVRARVEHTKRMRDALDPCHAIKRMRLERASSLSSLHPI